MNIIDISSWQSGIDLATVFALNPLDGVVVKATQGLSYVNPDFAKWTKWLNDNGKPFGFYHYLDGGNAEAEAEHFYRTVKPYIGEGIPVADYEGEALASGTAWLRRFLTRFRELSGVRCMIYCSISVVQGQNFSALTDYPLWIAQYADMATVNGFLDHPWQKGNVSPFNSYAMHQYTSCGRLNGYGWNLDFDKFYGSYAAWVEMARGETDPSPAPAPTPTPAPSTIKPADPSVVLDVLKNKYGIEQDRVNALRQAGYDPVSVQNAVNRIYGIAQKVKQDIGKDMDYINSILWIVRS